jgi:ubiquinone/menaquinone biosynthesis C-methylase UbiE
MATPTLTEIAYRTLQQSRSLAGLAHKELSTRLMEWVAPESTPQTETAPDTMLLDLRRSLTALENLDWKEAQEGLYPTRHLFDIPWVDWATRYPRLWLDLPSTWMRRKERNVRDLPDDARNDLYPSYYLQNFHHQTDGYLSDHSAELYDLQVDILFNGAADAMRRRVIAPLKRGLRRFADRPGAMLKVLDVATGTGRTLHQIRAAIPDATLIGVDLSEAYLRQANRWLNQGRQGLVQLLQGNGESLPFAESSMQAVTCVFLLHELPGDVRQAVLQECHRVLEPGGVLVLVDSIQLADSPQFSVAMENFRRSFHEPYYPDYIRDDINGRLTDAGFQGITAESHFMARVWAAQKAS